MTVLFSDCSCREREYYACPTHDAVLCDDGEPACQGYGYEYQRYGVDALEDLLVGDEVWQLVYD